MDKQELINDRISLKSKFVWLENSQVKTDQDLGLPKPTIFKIYENYDYIFELPKPKADTLQMNQLFEVIEKRKSVRQFTNTPLTIDELSFLLWATQGVRVLGPEDAYSRRIVPSGGSRHTFETYLAIHNVTDIQPGIYHYLPKTHQIGLLFKDPDLQAHIMALAKRQEFVAKCAVTFIWSCIPYRAEWRYHWESHKMILMDTGHVCQNLYLAAEAINAGTCAIGAYDQEYADKYLHLDGNDEFVIYAAPVGKVL